MRSAPASRSRCVRPSAAAKRRSSGLQVNQRSGSPAGTTTSLSVSPFAIQPCELNPAVSPEICDTMEVDPDPGPAL